MNNKEMSPNSGEINNQTPRSTYEERGEKAIDANEIEYVTTPYGGVVPRLKKHEAAPEKAPDDSAQGVEIEYVTTPYGGVVPRVKRPNAPTPEPKPEAEPASTNQESGTPLGEGNEVEDFTARLRRQREEMNASGASSEESSKEEVVETVTEDAEKSEEDSEIDELIRQAREMRAQIKKDLARIEDQINQLEQAHAGANLQDARAATLNKERIAILDKEREVLLDDALKQELNAARTAEVNTGRAEVINPKAEAAYDKTRKSEKSPSKAKIRNIAKKALVSLLLVASFATGFMGGYNYDRDNFENDSTPQSTEEQTFDGGERHELEYGIKDGYNEKGMWESSEKPSDYAFASAKEIATIFDGDECEMMKYTAGNQVESLADYIANMPEELQPEGFKGLSILETEAKLESLSDKEYNAIKNQFDQQIDQAFTRKTTLNGNYQNSYMRLKDPNGPVTHDNMELVECTTNENGLRVVEFYWLDQNGNEIGSMTVKIAYDENGNINGGCMQAVNPEGSTPIYTAMPSVPDQVIPPTPDKPESEPEPKPDPTPTPEPDPTPEPTPDPTPTPEPTPDPTPEPTPDPTPDPTPAPKDYDNMERIDEQILDDIADDIGTDEVVVTPTPEVSPNDLTEQPTAEAYEGTAPTIVQNEASVDAEPIQEQISPENDYSQNLGGANAGEYAPVQTDEVAQAQADAAEIPIEQAPGVQDVGGQELNDILNDLGIN